MYALTIDSTHLQNKSISDNIEEILVLQGVGWIKRKAIVTATITLAIKHVKEDDVETIDIDQTLTGGIPGTAEHRELTWVERPHEDHIFGAVVGKSRRVQLSTLTEEGRDEYLTTGWTEDTKEHGAIESYVESDTPKSGTTWIANQVCLVLSTTALG